MSSIVRSNILGITLMVITAILLSLFSAIVKKLSAVTTLSVEVLIYYFIPLLFIVPFLFYNQNFYRTKFIFWYGFRSLFAILSITCFFYTARNIPLGLAVLLYNTIPIFVLLLAGFFLKEKITTSMVIGVCLASIGIAIILNPKFSQIDFFFCMVGLASGFLMAAATVMMKHLTNQGEPVNRIIFYLYFFCSLFSIIAILVNLIFHRNYFLLNSHLHISLASIITLLLLLGIFSIAAQITFTKASQYLMVSKQAPFFFLSVVFSSIIGFILWHQNITFLTIIGALLIFIGICTVSIAKSKRSCEREASHG